MNKITNLFGILLIVTLSACANSKTAADAPNSTDTNGKISTAKNGNVTQEDAQSPTRRKQLDADIKAREQRNVICRAILKNVLREI